MYQRKEIMRFFIEQTHLKSTNDRKRVGRALKSNPSGKFVHSPAHTMAGQYVLRKKATK